MSNDVEQPARKPVRNFKEWMHCEDYGDPRQLERAFEQGRAYEREELSGLLAEARAEVEKWKAGHDDLQQELMDAQTGCIHCGNGGFVEIEGQRAFCRCPIGERDAALAQLSLIRNCANARIADGPHYPCRVDEMTEREAQISNVAAHYCGALMFIAESVNERFVESVIDSRDKEIERLRAENESLKESINSAHTQDAECFYCHEQTSRYAADPTQWPLWFTKGDGTYKVKAHHTGCVQKRLALVDSLSTALRAARELLDDTHVRYSKDIEELREEVARVYKERDLARDEQAKIAEKVKAQVIATIDARFKFITNQSAAKESRDLREQINRDIDTAAIAAQVARDRVASPRSSIKTYQDVVSTALSLLYEAGRKESPHVTGYDDAADALGCCWQEIKDALEPEAQATEAGGKEGDAG